jgi:hypothetical protein
MNGGAVRKAFEEGVARMEQALAAGRPDRLAESGGLGRGPHRGGLCCLHPRDSLNRIGLKQTASRQ